MNEPTPDAPRSDPAAPAPPTPPVPRAVLVAGGGLALLLLGAGGVYLASPMRTVERVEEDISEMVNPGTIETLLDNADEPRARALLRAWYVHEAENCYRALNDYYRGKLDQILPGLEAHPPEVDDAWVEAIAKLSLGGDWTAGQRLVPGYDEDPRVVEAALDYLTFYDERPHFWAESGPYHDRYAEVVLRVLALLEARGVDPERYAERTIRIAFASGRADLLAVVDRWGEDDPRVVAARAERVARAGGAFWKESERYARLQERVAAIPTEALGEPLLDAFLANFAAIMADELQGPRTISERSDSERCVAALRARGGDLGRRLRQRAFALEEGPERLHGRLLALRLGAAGPGDAEAVLARVSELTPRESGKRKPLKHYTAYREALTAVGPAGHDPLLAALRERGNARVAPLCARVLAAVDAERFAGDALGILADYEPLAWRFLARGVEGAEEEAARFRALQLAATQSLEALARVEGRAVDVAFVAALACPDSGIQEYAATTLRERLDTDGFADVLFHYLASRPSFRVREVKVYEDALTSYADVTPAIVRNLTALLERAGAPDDVSWIHKVIAFEALAKVGTAAAVPVLERYAQDTESYEHVETVTRGAETTETTREIAFADLAREARDACRER